MNATPQRLVVIEAEANGTARGASFDPADRDAIAKALAGTAALIFLVDGPKLDQVDADFPQGKLASCASGADRRAADAAAWRDAGAAGGLKRRGWPALSWRLAAF